MRMVAARLHGNRDLRVEQIESPGPLGPREARVQPKWCGICGSDLHEYTGPVYLGATLPQILGHEFSAEVVEIGSDVTNVAVGDRCAVLPHVFCGQCYFCHRGRQGLCRELRITGFGWPWGGLAGEAVVPSYQCIPLPDGVSFEQGAILEPLGTVVYASERVSLRSGDTVLVTGGGPVGQLAVMVAAAAGADAIYLSEPNPIRLAQAEKLGVTGVFDPRSTDVAAEVLERTDGLGVDISMECAGSQPALDTCVDATRAGGSIAQIALHVGTRTVVPETWTWKDLTLAGTWSFRFYDAPRILRQVASGKLPVERIVTSRIPLEDVVPRGIEALADRDAAETKILVEVGGAS
jgi:(R,R)-butanediol dehydrogenase / meso-butanediol dehydrogenase / diacetyl reductase